MIWSSPMIASSGIWAGIPTPEAAPSMKQRNTRVESVTQSHPQGEELIPRPQGAAQGGSHSNTLRCGRPEFTHSLASELLPQFYFSFGFLISFSFAHVSFHLCLPNASQLRKGHRANSQPITRPKLQTVPDLRWFSLGFFDLAGGVKAIRNL